VADYLSTLGASPQYLQVIPDATFTLSARVIIVERFLDSMSIRMESDQMPKTLTATVFLAGPLAAHETSSPG
jgi:hypothetical protein